MATTPAERGARTDGARRSPDATRPARLRHQWARRARRTLGAALVLLVALPVYRVLRLGDTGPAGAATIRIGDAHAGFLAAGTLTFALIAVLAAMALPPGALVGRARALVRAVERVPSAAFAGVLAAAAGLLTLGFGTVVLDGRPNLIDAMSQLVHARYLAAGELAGPASPLGAFWHLQNSVITEHGWVSQYPPGHALALALGLRVGAVWAVGPALLAATALFTALAAERLFPEDRALARLGAVLGALSPLLLAHAGAFMNHATAAACGSLAVYAGLRARDGHGAWAALAGAAVGAAFATRPLYAVVIGVGVLTAIGAWARARNGWGWRPLAGRALAACLGAAPFIAAVAAYNGHFFGSPFRFGYEYALGEAAALGFHRDPWGNLYTPLAALGYTSADLVALSLNLLETPVPAVVIVGAFLLLARRLAPAERLVAAWALLPVLAGAFYWHHGLFMGPRMLAEAAPAWGLLTAVGAVRLVRLAPATASPGTVRLRPRAGLTAALAASLLLAVGWLAPQRLAGYGTELRPDSRLEPPRPSGPALVFVHGGWTSRVAMRLAAAGMRLDSVETALRRNDTCDVHRFALAYTAGRAVAGTPAVDFARRAGTPAGLGTVELSPGNRILVSAERAEMPRGCAREAAADRAGVVDVSPLLWRGDLSGLPAAGPLYVRDLGPEANARLLARFPDRRPTVVLRPEPDADPVLLPYAEGMAALWGEDAADARTTTGGER